jgi:hypothetical protein
MAVLGNTVLNLSDIAKREEVGMPAKIAYLLEQELSLFSSMSMVPTNKTTSHLTTVQTGEPTVSLKALNVGTVSSKGTVEQQEDGLMMLEAWSTTDAELLKFSVDKAAVRAGEGRMFISAMRKAAEGYLLYGNVTTDPKQINGLSVRDPWNSLGDQCLGCAGTGSDLSSIWLIVSSPETIFMTYPMNSVGGLDHKDWGPQIIQTDTNLGGAKLGAVVDQWLWALGLVTKDQRFAVRICNIENVDVLGVSGTQELADYTTNIRYRMTQAYHRIWNINMGTAFWLMPRIIAEGFAIQAQATLSANGFTFEQISGRKILSYMGIPIKISDQLLNTETQVS